MIPAGPHLPGGSIFGPERARVRIMNCSEQVNTQEVRVKRAIFGVVAACAFMGIVLSGCGINSASSKPTPTASHHKTALPLAPVHVTPPLAGFASYTVPIIQTSLKEGYQLLATMKRPDYAVLGDQCNIVGGDLSNQHVAFYESVTPSAASRMRDYVHRAYRLALSATDECGLASDSSDGKQLSYAYKDLQTALGRLSYAASTIKRWQTSKA